MFSCLPHYTQPFLFCLLHILTSFFSSLLSLLPYIAATLHRLRADLRTAAIRDGASIKDEPDTINQVSLVSLRVTEDDTITGEEQQTIKRH